MELDSELYRHLSAMAATTIKDVVVDYEWQVTAYMPIAFPGFDQFTQPGYTHPIPMARDGAWRKFQKSLIPARSRNNAIVYPVTIHEDPQTRDRLVLNSNGKVIYREPAPADYDWRWYLLAHKPDVFNGRMNATESETIKHIYDPSRFVISYDLIEEEQLFRYCLTTPATESSAEPGGTMAMCSSGGGGSVSNLKFTAIEATASGMELTVSYPFDAANYPANSYTGKVNIFKCHDLLEFWWGMGPRLTVSATTNSITWCDTGVLNPSIKRRFYMAANGNINSDGDIWTDAEERFLFRTDPSNANSRAVMASGATSYGGSGSGLVRTVMVTNRLSWTAGPWYDRTGAGAYYVLAGNDRTYWIKSYMDSNQNGVRDIHDPAGIYSTQGIYLSGNIYERNFDLIDVNLTATGLDGPVSNSDEETPGVFSHFNVDDDYGMFVYNNPGTWVPGFDYQQTIEVIPGENDLVPLVMNVTPLPQDGSLELTVPHSNMALWSDPEKGISNFVMQGSTTTNWNLAVADERNEFLWLSTNLWVEGIASDDSTISLQYVTSDGEVITSDSVNYHFIAAECGRQPWYQQYFTQNMFTNLVDCEWTVSFDTDEEEMAAGNYNCIAWSVWETNAWYSTQDIDEYYGDNDGIFEDSDMDAFYFAKKGYTPTASGPEDAVVMYYPYTNDWDYVSYPNLNQVGYHAAVKMQGCDCGNGQWIMYESKLGGWTQVEHRWEQLNSYGTGSGDPEARYGSPGRFYK